MLVGVIAEESLIPTVTVDSSIVRETAAAVDVTGAGLFFTDLVDDPASVTEILNGYLGSVIDEATNATDVPDAQGPPIGADLTETTTTAESWDGALITDVVISETTTTAETPDASIIGKAWNPSDQVNTTLSNGNLTATSQGTSGGVRATCSVSTGQKIYWEITLATITSANTITGCARSTANLANMAGLGTNNAAVMFGNGTININAGFAGSIGTRSSGDVIGIAVDFTGGLIWFRVAPAGNWNGSGTANPATGAGGFSISGITGGPLYPNFSNTNLAGEVATANFGASAFTGAVPSGFNSGF